MLFDDIPAWEDTGDVLTLTKQRSWRVYDNGYLLPEVLITILITAVCSSILLSFFLRVSLVIRTLEQVKQKHGDPPICSPEAGRIRCTIANTTTTIIQ